MGAKRLQAQFHDVSLFKRRTLFSTAAHDPTFSHAYANEIDDSAA